jgi:NitT/TauT family transport system ATP-binding protein
MKDKPFRLDCVSHRFAAVEVLRELSFEIERGEFLAVVGPSGCGKTTLLGLLSGHQRPTAGCLEREGGERMVYQCDGLYPWRTVFENIGLGLRDLNEEDQLRELQQLVELMALEGFEHHYPHQLSGGMRQRVELARALAGESRTLLMDEPFSSLDYLTRVRMRHELSRILDERPRTVVLVTHDIEEACQLADRVIVLTERPARIRFDLRMDTPRPRELTDPKVIAAAVRILKELGLQSTGVRATAAI